MHMGTFRDDRTTIDRLIVRVDRLDGGFDKVREEVLENCAFPRKSLGRSTYFEAFCILFAACVVDFLLASIIYE